MPLFLKSQNFLSPSTFPEQEPQHGHKEPFNEIAILEFIVVPLLFLILGVLVVICKCQFSHVAFVNLPSYNTSLKVKIWSMLILMGFYIVSSFLAFLDSSYWVNRFSPFCSLLNIIPLTVLFLNIDWLIYQFERRIPLVWYQNQLFWTLLTLAYLMGLASCQLTNEDHDEVVFGIVDTSILCCKFLTSFYLMLYTFKRSQDLESYRTEGGLTSRLLGQRVKRRVLERSRKSAVHKEGRPRKNSMGHSHSRKRRITTNRNDDLAAHPLTITVINKVQKSENPTTGAMEVFYKLQVRAYSKDLKILRTLNDFRKLDAGLREEAVKAPTANKESLSALLNDREAEHMTNVSFIVLTLQNLLASLLKTETISPALIDFLDIPEPQRSRLLLWSKSNPGTSDVSSDLNETIQSRRTSIEGNDDYEDENQSTRSETTDRFNGKINEREFCPFFNVNIPKYRKSAKGDHVEYPIYLQLVEKPDESWHITTRYSDFVNLREQLKNALGVVPPKLPKKVMVFSAEDELEQRKKGLESWLRVVLNEKVFFSQVLFKFIKLNPSYNEWLKDEEAHDFSNFRATIDSNQILMSDNKPYTVYHIIIEDCGHHDSKRSKQGQQLLKRRYKEFYQLHQALQRRYASSSVRLPELPPKYTTFSNKTNVDFRQEGLEQYLNGLFNFPNIGDSFAFRKFLNFKRIIDSTILPRDLLEKSKSVDANANVSVNDFSTFKIEQSLSTARSYRSPQKTMMIDPEYEL